MQVTEDQENRPNKVKQRFHVPIPCEVSDPDDDMVLSMKDVKRSVVQARLPFSISQVKHSPLAANTPSKGNIHKPHDQLKVQTL